MKLTLKDCIFNNQATDLLIEEGKIAKIGKHLDAEKIIDCRGLVLIPGLIDSHVHFRTPGAEYKEDWKTGSRAAAKGGVTTVLDMPNTNPPTVDQASLDQKRQLTRESIVNFGFHFGATKENISLAKKIKGIAGVKVFVGSSTGTLLMDNPDDLKELFSDTDQLFLVHAENEQFIQEQTDKYKDETDPIIHTKIRAPKAAAKSVSMLLKLIEQTGARVHFCHVSTARELELISEAKRRGLPITCEVTPHHLFLTEEEYSRKGNLIKTNPPLRSETDRQALWKGIKEGVVDTIGTDHAPHTREEKEKDYWQAPSGVPGVETMLPLLLNEVAKGNLDLGKITQLTSNNPAQIFKIQNKGRIEESYDADLALVDLNLKNTVKENELETKCGWSPFADWLLTGWPVVTIVNGNIVFNKGTVFNKAKGREIEFLSLKRRG